MNDVVAIAFGEELQKIAEYVSGHPSEAPPAMRALFGTKPEDKNLLRRKKKVEGDKPSPMDKGTKGTPSAFDRDAAGWGDQDHNVNKA